MEVPGPDSNWRSLQFRQKVVAQIEEAMRKAGTANQSSNDMEKHVYDKAKTREEYLSLVARLIIHFRDIYKKALGGPDPMELNMQAFQARAALQQQLRVQQAQQQAQQAAAQAQLNAAAAAAAAGAPGQVRVQPPQCFICNNSSHTIQQQNHHSDLQLD